MAKLEQFSGNSCESTGAARCRRLLRAAVVFFWVGLMLGTGSVVAQVEGVPTILVQPESQTVALGSEVTLTVVAEGARPLFYQWYLQQTNALAGATNEMLVLPSFQASDAGPYTVLITNISGSVTSAPALLSLQAPPRIVEQPVGRVVASGSEVTFSVRATGTPPLTYQWYRDVIHELLNATNSALVLSNVQPADSGTYQVVIVNDYGFASSVEALLTVKTIPSILIPPQSLVVTQGASARFSVTVSGDGPFSYQWYTQETNRILGAVSDTLQIDEAEAVHAGSYSVAVSNEVGGAVSAPAILSVLIPPYIITQPVSQVVTEGSPVQFTAAVGGDHPLRHQWFFNDISLAALGTNSTYSLTAARTTDAGEYHLVVMNDVGAVTSQVARLTVQQPPVIHQQPASLVVTQGNAAEFSVVATGAVPLTYQWLHDGDPISEATNRVYGIPATQASHAGMYRVELRNGVGTVLSDPALLTVRVPPKILEHPSDLTLVRGQTATFSVTASGDPTLHYQWYFDEILPIAGANGPELKLVNVGGPDVGTYAVVISNSVGVARSGSAFLDLKVPPQIVQSPVSLTVTQGSTVELTVQASGDPVLCYQWYFNETNALPTGTNSTLTIPFADRTAAGSYLVRVSNVVGTAVSSAATISVRVPPAILVQPAGINAQLGSPAALSVVASGDGPLRYQWYLSSSTVLAATNSVLTFSSVQPSDEGTYTVRVSNDWGSVLSDGASISIKSPPSILTGPVSLTATQGIAVRFEVHAQGGGPLQYHWLLNGTNVVLASGSATLLLPAVQPADAGTYSVLVSNDVGTVLSSAAVLSVRLVPNITRQPASTIVAVGSNAVFSVLASGEPPLFYRWFNPAGGLIAGATGPVLNLANVSLESSGEYRVLVTNAVGAVLSAPATLSVQHFPAVLRQPSSIVATQGLTARMTVEATGGGVVRYQWFRNRTNQLVSGTGATLTIPKVSLLDAGLYSVQVWNDVGTVYSDEASLVVRPLPVISQQPASLIVTQGSTAEFSVIASGETSLSYQWRKDGASIPGQTNPILTLTQVQPTNVGLFDVLVRNDYGATTSAVAILIVRGLDWGDAAQPPYPTLQASDGARHVLASGLFLGAGVDAEPDGQPSVTADADDQPPMDTPGIALAGSMVLGQTVQCRVVASSNGFLNGWIDFNGDGSWAHPTEQVFVSRAVSTGTNALTIAVPSTAIPAPATARFRLSSTAILQPTGLAADGEVEDYQFQIQPAADLQLSQTVSSGRVAVGAPVTFSLSVSNAGPSTASGVAVAVPITPIATYVSSSSDRGGCAVNAGVLTCGLGVIEPGQAVNLSYTVTVGAGTNQSVGTVAGAEFDPVLANNTATRSAVGVINLPTYSNGEATILPELDPGPGSVYPLDIFVSGQTSIIEKVTVTVHNINHAWPDDLDVLLVGPNGARVLLMSDCGLDNNMTDVTLTFDDLAAPSLPNSDPPITSGTYKPTNFDRLSDTFRAPAPPEPYVTNLSVFRGVSPNGTWSLYVMDDSPENGGFIADGWSLNLSLADPIADFAIAATGPASPLTIGQNGTYQIAVTNRGPSTGHAIIRDVLPPGFSFVGFTTSQGTCSHSNGVVVCELGLISPGGTAGLTISAAPSMGGVFTNTIVVSTPRFDPVTSNNVATVQTTVIRAADVSVALINGPVSGYVGQAVAYDYLVRNLGPNSATGIRVLNWLPPDTTFVSATPGQGTCSVTDGVVLCDVGNLPVSGTTTLRVLVLPTAPGTFTNVVEVFASENDFSTANNATMAVTEILPVADFVLSPSAKVHVAVLGQEFTIGYSVSNAGPSTAASLVLASIPAGITFIEARTSHGECVAFDGLVRCDIEPLAGGEVAQVEMVVRGAAVGSSTNTASVRGEWTDLNENNNLASSLNTVISGADLGLTATVSPSPVWLGEYAAFSLRVTNSGPSTATSVILTNRLSPSLDFVSASSAQGACSHLGSGLIRCDLLPLAAGSIAEVSVLARARVAGLATNLVTIRAAETDPIPANNAIAQVVRLVSSSGSFTATGPIEIPSAGPGSGYPSVIYVAGMTAAVFDVRITLHQLTHAHPDDLDLLLVAPGGQSLVLMSDAGGATAVNALSLTFSDSGQPLPDEAPLVGLLARATDFEATDLFPSPAPLSPYGTNISVFTGTNPNGPWSLYLVDDREGGAGRLEGWSLTFSTLDAIADLRLVQSVSPNPVAAGGRLETQFLLTNKGPASASAVRFTNTFGGVLSDVIFSTSQGSCLVAAGFVVCSLGNIPSGGSVQINVSGQPAQAAFMTNAAVVVAAERDLAGGDNRVMTVVEVENAPVILAQPADVITTIGSTVVFNVNAAGTPPLTYQWSRNGAPVAGATGPSLALTDVTRLDSGFYQVRVSNRVGTVLSGVAELSVVGAPAISEIAPITLSEDGEAGPIPFTVYDENTTAREIDVFGGTSAPEIIPTNNIVFGGRGSNRTVRVFPLPNANGQLTIYVNARGIEGGVTVRPVAVNVVPVNDLPSLSPFDDVEGDEDVPVAIPFVAWDVDTPPEEVRYQIVSSNPSVLVPSGALFQGQSSNRLLTLQPVADAHGTSVVSVIMTDRDGASVSNAFSLAVHPVNDVPTLGPIADQSIAENSGVHLVTLTGITSGATNEHQRLTVTAISDNLALIPPPAVAYVSPQTNGTLTLAPRSGVSGVARIRVTVGDGAPSNHIFSREFTVTVNGIEAPPYLSTLTNQTIDEDGLLSIPLNVGDPDTAPETLRVEVVSSNPALVNETSLVVMGQGANRTLTVRPRPDQFGETVLSVRVTDPGGLSATHEFVLTVVSVNDPPTLGPIGNVAVQEDSAPIEVALTGISSGAANENQPLSVTAVSSNRDILPDPVIHYNSPEQSGTLTLNPAANVSGVATVTVTLHDGSLVNEGVSRTFTVTVLSQNDPPVISSIPDVTVNEDGTNQVAFTIGDVEGNAGLLTLTASSSNPSLISPAGIQFSGAGSNRLAVLVPQPNQFGTAIITIVVSDGATTGSRAFNLTVNPVNDRPTLNVLTNIAVATSPGVMTVPLSGISSGAPNEAQALAVTVSSSNPGFFLNPPVVNYTSPATTGTLSFRPSNNTPGAVTITVTVSDNGASNATISRSFVLYVRPNSNIRPTISAIPNQTIAENTTLGPIGFSVRDAETPASSLVVSATSLNPDLLPAGNITLGGTGTNRTITLTPAANQSGVAGVMLTVVDSSFGASNLLFNLTVTGVNESPAISPIANQSISEDTSTGLLNFTVADADTAPGGVAVWAESGDVSLVSPAGIQLGGSGSARTLQVTPERNRFGSTTITIRASDGTTTNLMQFTLSVEPVNDVPTLGAIADQALDEDSISAPIAFEMGDVETAVQALQLELVSSNPSLVDPSGLIVERSGTALTLIVQPKPDRFGSAIVGLRLSDADGGVTTNQFALTVNAVNDPPTLDPVSDRVVAGDGVPRTFELTGISAGPANEPPVVIVTGATDRPDRIGDLQVIHVPGASTASLVFTPLAGASGNAVITLIANDGQPSNNIISRTFTVRLNEPPQFTYIADQTTREDSLWGPIGVGVTDADSGGGLNVSIEIEDPSLVPPGNVTLSGSGTDWFITLLPATNRVGSSLVRVVAVDADGGRATNQFLFTVLPVIDPIFITSQPIDRVVLAGTTLTLAVTAESALPLSYQWQYNGSDIDGAIAPGLVLNSVQPAQAGVYRVLISSSDLTVLSDPATLTVTNGVPGTTIESIELSPGGVRVSFPTVSGLNYTLEYKNALDEQSWTAAGTSPGNGSILVIVDEQAVSQTRFYRIRTE